MLNNNEFWCDLAPWDKYKSDVILVVHHILTEPVCPTVEVKFELERCPIQHISSGSGDTVHEAIDDAVRKAVQKLKEWKKLTLEEIVEREQARKQANHKPSEAYLVAVDGSTNEFEL